MIEQKTVLTTEGIRNMSLKEFLAFKQDRYEIIAMRDLQQANSTWLLVSDLEAVTSLKKLKKLTAQLKEDLWWNIQRGGKEHDE